MIKKYLKLSMLALSLIMVGLVFASCQLFQPVYFDSVNNQALKENCLQRDFAIIGDNIIKLREYENNLAYVSGVDSSLELVDNINKNALYQPTAFTSLGDYLFAFYESDISLKIDIHNIMGDNFTDFLPEKSYSLNQGKLVSVQKIDNSIYISLLIASGSEHSIRLNDTTLKVPNFNFNNYKSRGYLVLAITLSDGVLSEKTAFLSGANPKDITILDSGIFAFFRTKKNTSYLVKYKLSDFSVQKNQKIDMGDFHSISISSERIALVSTGYDGDYVHHYNFFLYDKDLKLLGKAYEDNFSVSHAIFLADKYQLFSHNGVLTFYHEYSLVDSQLTKKNKTFDSIFQNTNFYSYITRNVTHSISGDDNSLVAFFDSVGKKIVLFDFATNTTVSEVSFSHYSFNSASAFYYNALDDHLYFIPLSYDTSDSYTKYFYKFNTKLENSYLIKVPTDRTDSLIGISELQFEGFRFFDDRVYLVYNSIVVVLDSNFIELDSVDLRKTVSIYFVNEDGSEAAPTLYKEVGHKITSKEIRDVVPTREGYRFVKWEVEAGEKLYNLYKDVTLTAVWEVDNND